MSSKGKHINIGKSNGMWKGNDVGYIQLHAWIKQNINKPKICESCNSNRNIDLANISQKYRRSLNDWK